MTARLTEAELADRARARWHRGVMDADLQDAERLAWDAERMELDK